MVNPNNLRNSVGRSPAAERRNFGENEMALAKVQRIGEILAKRTLVLSPESVREELVESFSRDKAEGIEFSDALKLSLSDPISRTRIHIPVRSILCKHFQCFDLATFLETCFREEAKNANAWFCPTCKCEAKQDQLRIDGFFEQILQKVGPEALEVEISSNGTWREVEQEDVKMIPIGDTEDEISLVVPRKRAKFDDSPGNSTEKSRFAQISWKLLNELLGVQEGESPVEAIQALKARTEAQTSNETPGRLQLERQRKNFEIEKRRLIAENEQLMRVENETQKKLTSALQRNEALKNEFTMEKEQFAYCSKMLECTEEEKKSLVKQLDTVQEQNKTLEKEKLAIEVDVFKQRFTISSLKDAVEEHKKKFEDCNQMLIEERRHARHFKEENDKLKKELEVVKSKRSPEDYSTMDDDWNTFSPSAAYFRKELQEKITQFQTISAEKEIISKQLSDCEIAKARFALKNERLADELAEAKEKCSRMDALTSTVYEIQAQLQKVSTEMVQLKGESDRLPKQLQGLRPIGNISACKNPGRDKIPKMEEFLAEALDELDPDWGLKPQNQSVEGEKFQWRASRFLLFNSDQYLSCFPYGNKSQPLPQPIYLRKAILSTAESVEEYGLQKRSRDIQKRIKEHEEKAMLLI